MLKENPTTVIKYSKLIHQKKTTSIEGVKKFTKINSKKRKRRRSSTSTSSNSSSSSSSSSSDEKRKSEKKRKRRKKTRNFPRQGKESDKSEKMEANQQHLKRFTILNQYDPAR